MTPPVWFVALFVLVLAASYGLCWLSLRPRPVCSDVLARLQRGLRRDGA